MMPFIYASRLSQQMQAHLTGQIVKARTVRQTHTHKEAAVGHIPLVLRQ